jgi:hypothetical protein
MADNVPLMSQKGHLRLLRVVPEPERLSFLPLVLLLNPEGAEKKKKDPHVAHGGKMSEVAGQLT